VVFSLQSSPHPRDLHSFPTRRSSDLAAFPELNAWERAGADASSAGMVDAGFENQKELTKMQLDNQKEIAEMQNETQKEIASAPADRKSGSAGMPRPISYAVFCLKKNR